MNSSTGVEQILDAKRELVMTLRAFVADYTGCNKNSGCIAGLIGELVERHSAILNTVNRAIAKAHASNDFFQEKSMRQDYAGTIKNFVRTSFSLIATINVIADQFHVARVVVPGSSYVTIQRFINTFFGEQERADMFNQFLERKISTEGFSQKFKRNMKHKILQVQLWVSIPLLALCGILVFGGELILGKDFTGMQLIFLKAVLALSISVVGSSLLEGNVNYQWSLQKGLTIRAIGWAGVFILLYFLNPASPGRVF